MKRGGDGGAGAPATPLFFVRVELSQITTQATVLQDRSKTHSRPQNFYIITVIVFQEADGQERNHQATSRRY